MKRPLRTTMIPRFVIATILSLLMILLFPFAGSLIARPHQKPIMEYYVYYQGQMAKIFNKERYEQAFATFDEAKNARDQAAIASGNREDFLRDTYIKEVPSGRYTTPPKNPATPTPDPVNRPTTVRADPPSPTKPSPGNFSGDKADLLGRLRTGASELSFDGNKRPLVSSLRDGSPAVDPEIGRTVADLTKMDPATEEAVTMDIVKRQVPPNPWSNGYRRTLKIKAPPPLFKTFAQIQPGDVLLVAAEGVGSALLRFYDQATSLEFKSRASHTFTCVKVVKGVKIFLDSQPGEGPRIKTEKEILKTYAGRGVDLAQPISKIDADLLWAAAKELAVKQIDADLRQAGRPIKDTHWGLYGDDQMVCSEVSRWLLIKAGAKIGKTWSPAKINLGIDFGPSNFYSDNQPFLVTPMDPFPPLK